MILFRVQLFSYSRLELLKYSNFKFSTKLSNSMSANTTSTKDETTLKNKYKPKECQFKTSYGHIAGLEWGKSSAPEKIFCIHGWLDNAGSFERLVPFILDHGDNVNKYHIVAIDMPGVGFSSHLPSGSSYHQFFVISEMRRVMQQLSWSKVTLLSHSLGAHYSFLYSCIYGNQVENMISIDLAHPVTHQINNWQINLFNMIEEYFKTEYQHDDDPTTNIRVPVYSEVDAIKRLMDGHSASLTKESAEVLLKRGAKKQRWGFTFNRDTRWRQMAPEFRPNDDAMLQYLSEPFKPNLLIVRANRSPYHRPEATRLKYYEMFKKNCPIFHDVMMDGTHHLHMNTPEMVAPEINKFLEMVDSAIKPEQVNNNNINHKSNL